MTLAEVEEELRDLMDRYSEDERGHVDGHGLCDAVYELLLRLERHCLTGVASVPSLAPPRMFP